MRRLCDDRLDVERHDGAQVDHLGLDPLGRQRLGRLERPRHHLAGRDDGDVASPARAIRATPNGTKCSPTGTSPLEAKSAFGSSMITGSPARSAVFISPLASAGVEGTQTTSPGMCAKTG